MTAPAAALVAAAVGVRRLRAVTLFPQRHAAAAARCACAFMAISLTQAQVGAGGAGGVLLIGGVHV